ncbi:MAG TPA: N-methyl-L-tryptophan oxidase [Gemmatimonadales bacterium]
MSDADVIVVGLGAVGAAAAWQLAGRGLRVRAFDARRPPHSAGSTHGGSRVIRETAFEHPRYVPLVRRGYQLWADLAARAGRQLLSPSGALYAGVPQASVVAGSRQSAQAHGVACEELTAAQLRARWPVFACADGMIGLFEPGGGILRPESCIRALLDAAEGEGASLHFDEPMLEWGVAGNAAWIRTCTARYEAAHLVLALGPWMLPILEPLARGIWVERVVQHWFVPRGDAAPLSPGRMPIYLWEDADGEIFYGFPMLDGAMKCAVHHRGESTTADTARRSVSADEIARAESLLAKFIPAAVGPRIYSAVCLYTNTPDGDLLLDRHPAYERVILASPCNGIGFKFVPAIGEIVADLAQDRSPRFDIAPFGIARLRA